MKPNYRLIAGLFMLMAGSMAIGCRPKTTAQKIEPTGEDARHEVEQGMGIAKERAEEGK